MLVNILLGLFVYYPIFSGFFFMDDFYFLQVFEANNLGEFIDIFRPTKFIPYRPISQQLFFSPFFKLFGFNPWPFHFFILAVHIFNSWLVYKISYLLSRDKRKSKLLSLIYVVSPIHFVGLYSITGSYFLLGVFYFLLSFWLWLKYEQEKRSLFYYLAFCVFVLGLFASEIVAVLPLLVLLLFSFCQLKKLIPFFLMIGVNLYINAFYAGAPKTEAFRMKLFAFPSLFRWYLLRALGLPEGIRNGLWLEKRVIYVLFIFLSGLLAVGFYRLCKKYQVGKAWKEVNKYLAWIIIGALPFYFMPYHLNPIYFTLSFIGFLLLLEKIFSRKLLFSFTLCFVLLSFFSLRLLMNTHWTVRRSQLAETWINKVKKEYPSTPEDQEVVLLLNSKEDKEELELVFQKSRALQLLYNRDDLETIYQVLNNEP